MINHNLIKQFTRLIEKTKASSKPSDVYRLQIFINALRIIKQYNTAIQSGEALAHHPKVGKGIINRVNEILETGTLKELSNDDEAENKIKKKKKEKKEALMTVIGIGPSIAEDLLALGVKSINDLDKKVRQGSIEVSSAIKTGLKFYDKVKTAIPRQEVTNILEKIKSIIKIPLLEIIICGSYRRQLETSNDIDVLMYHPNFITRGDVDNSDVLKRVKDIRQC